MRHLVIVIDMSDAMTNIDMKPNRFICCTRMIEKFVTEFIDQNPISQLCFIVTRNKRAEKITDLNGNLKSQIEVLKTFASTGCHGEASIQNALELAYSVLRYEHFYRKAVEFYHHFISPNTVICPLIRVKKYCSSWAV